MRAYDKVIRVVKRIGLLNSIRDVLLWDSKVTMPKGAVNLRSEELVTLSTATRRNITHWFMNHLKAAKQEELSDDERANIREISWKYSRLNKVKQSLVTKRERIHVKSRPDWLIAQERNDFSIFQKDLEEIFFLAKRFARSIDPSKPAYEVLLEEYERDFTIDELTEMFEQIKVVVLELLSEQTDAAGFDFSLEEPVKSSKRKFNTYFAECIGYDFSKGRIDTSERSFEGAYGRIAIRESANWFESLFVILHESGHSFYTHGLPLEHYGTPLGQIRSQAVSESQSLIWQNYVGKSTSFWDYFFPRLKDHYALPFNEEDFLKKLFQVKLGLLRIKADELTYPLHIILRFEIERDFFSGKFTVADIPFIWNKKMKDYLGIESDHVSNGPLQDLHWAVGAIGYFPSYLLGSIIAAQLFAKAREVFPDLDEQFRNGNFKQFKTWLNDNIHSQGQRYSTKELIKRVTGKDISTADYIDLLKERYSSKKENVTSSTTAEVDKFLKEKHML